MVKITATLKLAGSIKKPNQPYITRKSILTPLKNPTSDFCVVCKNFEMGLTSM